jgi:hypothetical protein
MGLHALAERDPLGARRVAPQRVWTIGFTDVRAVMISAIRCGQIRHPGRLGARARRPPDSRPAGGVIPAVPFGNRLSGLTLAVNGRRPGPGTPPPTAAPVTLSARRTLSL